VRDGQFYVFDQYGYFERYLPRPGMKETIEEGAARTLTYRDAYSRWYSCFAPVKDAEGRVAAIFEIAMDYAVFEEARNEFATGLARSAGLVALALAVAVAASTFILLKGIRGLAAGASLVAAGNYAAEVEITTRDEIADLGMAFNSMTREIKAKVGTIVDLNAANSKFVPARFLDALGKKSILDVRLGDQVEKDMAVLFADIRNFTDLSEKMSPEANFAFLNGYLERMGPLIREAGGFIDKYIGDAIMALFPDDPADAARAALGMHAALASFPGVQIGVGIHSGRLMLGIVGERERFDGTVISDVVNLASRLESLTKLYGVSALASGKAARAGGADLSFRLLDSVKVKGKSEETEIFELLPPGEDGADLKAASDRRFQEARRLYAEGDMASALAAFESLVEENPADKPAALFCRRCEGYLARGLPADWNGVTVFSEK
jgi:class 3 adenylate cyclase/HAMP domain-containing protein